MSGHNIYVLVTIFKNRENVIDVSFEDQQIRIKFNLNEKYIFGVCVRKTNVAWKGCRNVFPISRASRIHANYTKW